MVKLRLLLDRRGERLETTYDYDIEIEWMEVPAVGTTLKLGLDADGPRRFQVHKITHDFDKGVVNVYAEDPLVLLDRQRAQRERARARRAEDG